MYNNNTKVFHLLYTEQTLGLQKGPASTAEGSLVEDDIRHCWSSDNTAQDGPAVLFNSQVQGTHLELPELFDGFFTAFVSGVSLPFQVLEVHLQFLLGSRCQGTLLPLILQFCFQLVELMEQEESNEFFGFKLPFKALFLSCPGP